MLSFVVLIIFYGINPYLNSEDLLSASLIEDGVMSFSRKRKTDLFENIYDPHFLV